MSSFPASSADDFSGEFAVDSDLSIDHGSTVPEAQGFKDPNPSYSQPSFEPIHVENENENDNKNGDFPVDHASAMPETYRSEGLNPSFSQSSYELIHVENENDKGYGGFGENDISGDDVFVSDSMVLSLPTEMKSKEFFTLQEWRRQKAIQLEEKEKRRRETRKGKEAEPYLQAFYEERKLDVESSKANNSEWEKALQGDEHELEASSWLHEFCSQYERQRFSPCMAILFN
ncbi:clathrin light chain 1-like isoform X2 [Quercus robur]|uniref:clathrin light chain 1-like isoform X2 n=1 Tax=Quercus robur TaxID=38942 RepID=UPI002161A4B9|nr:clathrin light chain 1-like isoform X2 [Quercus robur]